MYFNLRSPPSEEGHSEGSLLSSCGVGEIRRNEREEWREWRRSKRTEEGDESKVEGEQSDWDLVISEEGESGSDIFDWSEWPKRERVFERGREQRTG